MDSIYSLFLLLSLIASGLGATIFLLVVLQPNKVRKFGPRLALASLVCCATALLFGIISVSVHLVFGHGPDSVAPMTIGAFFGHHKAYWFVLFFTVLGFSAWRFAAPRRRSESSE
jgi:hypothetical protein